MTVKKVLAVDLGASSGRVMVGSYDGSRMEVGGLHRFTNDPMALSDTLYWDFLRLFHEIRQALLKSREQGHVESIGIDTWGVDYGLIDRKGRLLGNPVHYRDGRTAGYMEKSFERISREEFYGITGNQFMEMNTAFQLLSDQTEQPDLLKQADALLLMPDLFRYYLSGEIKSERTIASTTQLMDMREREWAWPVIERLGLPKRLFTPLISPGTVTGSVRPALSKELFIPSMQVVAVAGHDTQCALAAVPAKEKDFIFISCGTWSLMGTELREPIISSMALQYNITNEAGVEGTYSFLKNIIGLWLIQESRRQWLREGRDYDFGRLEEMALKARPLCSFIDPAAPEFVPAGNLPERIRRFCQETGQPVPATEGEIVCCIDQSLALTYRKTLEEIQDCTGKYYPVIHIVGGGAQSCLLCQMTANACGRPVVAGPVEASVFGNVMVQYMASGEFSGLEQARKALIKSVEPTVYEPRDTGKWEEAYRYYRRMPAEERNE